MVALQLMDEEGVDGRDVEDLDRQPPDLRHVEDLERQPPDLKLVKGPDSQEPSRPRTSPNPLVATASRPPVAAAKGSTVVAAALKPKNGVPKEKAIPIRQRVTKTKKNDGRPLYLQLRHFVVLLSVAGPSFVQTQLVVLLALATISSNQPFYESLVDWNLDEKVSTVTLDNCTTNDAVIPYLVRKIGKSKLLNDGKLLHMRCCAHILNLIVKDGLEHIKTAIENIRESVAYWTATPKRIEKFEEIAKFVKVTLNQKINLDCKTRWNSTFKMLNIAVPYKAVFIRASRVDKHYTCLPSEEEWNFATDIVERLRVFNDITELFSGTEYVTANLYFIKICEIRMKIRQWSTCGNPIIEAMSVSMVTKFDKYWSDIQGLMGIATILDPRLKNLSLLMCFEWLLGTTGQHCEDKCAEVIDLLTNLMLEYHMEEDECNTESSAPAPSNMEFLSSFSARVASTRPTSRRFKSELDRYLEDELVPLETKNFKVLDWWKVAGTRYPTLRRIARDIYAIPITTVASESAFSTSGRVLSEHRSRLTSKMLEALMCSQDWLRNKYKIDEKEKHAATFWSCLQDIQEGLQELEL